MRMFAFTTTYVIGTCMPHSLSSYTSLPCDVYLNIVPVSVVPTLPACTLYLPGSRVPIHLLCVRFENRGVRTYHSMATAFP